MQGSALWKDSTLVFGDLCSISWLEKLMEIKNDLLRVLKDHILSPEISQHDVLMLLFLYANCYVLVPWTCFTRNLALWLKLGPWELGNICSSHGRQRSNDMRWALSESSEVSMMYSKGTTACTLIYLEMASLAQLATLFYPAYSLTPALALTITLYRMTMGPPLTIKRFGFSLEMQVTKTRRTPQRRRRWLTMETAGWYSSTSNSIPSSAATESGERGSLKYDAHAVVLYWSRNQCEWWNSTQGYIWVWNNYTLIVGFESNTP